MAITAPMISRCSIAPLSKDSGASGEVGWLVGSCPTGDFASHNQAIWLDLEGRAVGQEHDTRGVRSVRPWYRYRYSIRLGATIPGGTELWTTGNPGLTATVSSGRKPVASTAPITSLSTRSILLLPSPPTKSGRGYWMPVPPLPLALKPGWCT